MSVSRILVSHGRVVRTDSAAVTPSRTSGRPPKPSARNMSDSIQTVTAAWITTTGQKSAKAKALRNSPNTVERLGTR